MSCKAASAYLRVRGGTYRVRVNGAGTGTSVFSGRLALGAGRACTAAALGPVEAEGASLRVALVADAVVRRTPRAAGAALAG